MFIFLMNNLLCFNAFFFVLSEGKLSPKLSRGSMKPLSSQGIHPSYIAPISCLIYCFCSVTMVLANKVSYIQAKGISYIWFTYLKLYPTSTSAHNLNLWSLSFFFFASGSRGKVRCRHWFFDNSFSGKKAIPRVLLKRKCSSKKEDLDFPYKL